MSPPDLLDVLTAEAIADPDTLGLILHGSRAAGVERPDSDYDLLRVVTDESFAERKEQGTLRDHRRAAGSPMADVAYICPDRLRRAAEQFDGYTGMYVTAKVLVDETGEVARLLGEIVARANLHAWEEIAETYDGYLNCFVRSLKAWRRGNELGGRMQAAHSGLCLVRLLFALERRWPPYHDQLGGSLRELEAAQGWEDGYLEAALTSVFDTGDPSFQQQLELGVESLLSSRGIAHEWGPDDDLEPLKAHRFEAEPA